MFFESSSLRIIEENQYMYCFAFTKLQRVKYRGVCDKLHGSRKYIVVFKRFLPSNVDSLNKLHFHVSQMSFYASNREQRAIFSSTTMQG